MKTKFNGILTLLLAFVVQLTFAQTKTISGTVTDEAGPLPGVSIVIKGTSTGTETDFDGNFILSASVGDILQFSFVGMTSQEVTVGDSNVINVNLIGDNLLEEVVVVGYGTKKRGAMSTSVSTVSSVQIEKQNNSVSIDNALQGAATGVQVIAQNGKPGNAAFVRIRGVGSINSGREPLYLLDGVAVNEEDIIGINPSDVSSMNVLKDAASTAIYGARGSNGVVLITTKSGKKNSKAVFSLSSKVGTSKEIDKNFRVMNAREKLEYERAIGVGVGAGITSPSEWNELLANDHNWDDDLLKDGQLTSINFSVSGGEEKLSYFLSIANDKDTGIIELIENAFERTSARLNVDYDARDWLTISTKIGFSTSNDQAPRDRNNIQNPISGRYTFNPYEPVYLYDDEGNTIPNLRGLPTYNPTHQGLSSLAQVRANEDNDTDNRFFATFSADAEIIEGLRYNFIFNGSYLQNTNRGVLHAGSALDLIFSGTPNGRASQSGTTRFTYDFTNKLSYQKTFNDIHDFSAMALTQYQQSDYEDYFSDSEGFVVNGPTTIDVAASPRGVGGSNTSRTLFSIAGSIDYVYDEKYIVNATIRRDGSSRFGSDSKYGTFWGASAGWNVHNEDFYNNSSVSNILNSLKLRFSAGTNGNDNIGLYQSQTLYGYNSYNGQNSSAPTQFGDSNLGWEESFTIGAGLEFGLFQSRLTGVFEYYKRQTDQLLLNVPITLTQGGGSILRNIGEIENSGFEFELRGDIIRKQDFTWNVGALFSLYDNKVVELADENDLFIPSAYYTGLRVGEEVHTFYLSRYAGVNPANGQALFYDTEGNITTTNDGGEVFLSGKSPFAKFDGGINTSITYKGFFANADIYYKGGNYIFNTVEQQLLSDGTGANSNQRVDAWNYWTTPGQTNVLPDPTTNNPFRTDASGNSDRYLQKGDYIRLRNLQVGYNVPPNFLEKTPLTKVRVYFSATNLWTYTPYYKGDPEVGVGSHEMPADAADYTSRNIIPGEFSLNSYPTLKSMLFGVDINF